MLRVERSGRVEATSAQGDVAHRPGPLRDVAGPPLVEIAENLWIHPRHARKRAGTLLLPGGWRIPFAGSLPRCRPAPEDPVIPSLGVRPDEVLYLKSRGRGAAYWMTDRGRIPAHGPTEEVAALHPHLLPVQGACVNRTRIRALQHGPLPRLVLDDGTRVQITSDWRPRVLEALAVPEIRYLERVVPEQEGLYLFGLRDWPQALEDMTAAQLQKNFDGDERVLIANMAWQTREYRLQGRTVLHGPNHRGYWYDPLHPVLRRAGVLPGVARAVILPPGVENRYAPRKRRPRTGIDHYLYFITLLKTMVGTYRLLTYEELGFDDPRPDLRLVGPRHPAVVLLVEKETVDTFAWDLARRFGCSLLITRGQPTFLATEYFARSLCAAGLDRVRVVAYVDYDPAGWIIAHAFSEQLSRYGIATASTAWLVRPGRFTPEELRKLSYPLSSRRAANRTELAAWMRITHGIHGEPRGISADVLRPVERLVAAFHEETGID